MIKYNLNKITLLADAEQTNKISEKAGWLFLLGSLLLVILAILLILITISYSRKKKYKKEQTFKIVSGKYKYMDIGSSYAFYFMIIATIIAAIVMFAIGISGVA
ncbi:hypothetical protein mflW37_6860 [Mesoplasma florum W37]|uniref:Uncharacterized protein n=1 Tax=Mesoplasma florum TaxID=2151 RepID=A0AAD0HSG0_MESFO|nr:hypothetical protein [Mesoplasma florum]AGY41753.1 hypothetical protein mflW37_6860 [Mesoplasma florum W37]AVN59957.1 hypothetical protein CG008_03615 [Mesoplasma florum]AVN66092.1 hypothetical protein MflW12_6870 [Mesoplasma florum]